VNWIWVGSTTSILALVTLSIFAVHRYQSPRLTQLLRQNALSLLSEGKREEGIRRLRLYLAQRPDDIQTATRLGMELSESPVPRDWWEAQKILHREVRAQRATTPVLTALLKLHLRMGEKGESLRVAEDLKKTKDITSEGARLVAEAYKFNNMLPEALQAAERSVHLNPDDLLSLAYYFPLLYESTESIDQLRAEIDRRVAEATDRPMVLLVAYTATRNAGYADAASYLHQAVRLAPRNLEVLLMAGGQALEGNPADAQSYFELAHQIAPEDPRVQLVYGRWLTWAGNTTEAADIYRTGWKTNGDRRYEFAWRLAEILIEINPKSDEVAKCFQQIVEANDYEPVYRFLRGRADMLTGQSEAAENHFLLGKRLIERLPSFSPLATVKEELAYKIDLGLSGVAYQRGDLSKAIRLADEAHRRLPREFVPLVTLGQLHFEVGNLESSEEAWAEAVAQPFRPAGALLGLARTKLALLNESPPSQRDIQPILQLIESAKLQSPNDPNLTLIEAETLFAGGRESEALDELRASVQLFDKSPMVAMSLVRLLVADENFKEASTRLDAMEKAFGKTWLTSITRVSLLCRSGNIQGAREVLLAEEALFPAPARSTRFRLLGHLADSLGDNDSARKYFGQAVAADPNDDDAWVYHWSWINDHDGPAAADKLIVSERAATGDRSVRWRWADSVRAMERHRAHPALAATTLAEHASILDQNQNQHWATWHVRGMEAEINGRVPESLGCYGRAIARGPAIPSVITRPVRRLLAARQFIDAQGILSFVQRQRLPFLEDRMLLTEGKLAQQQNEGALADVREIASQFSKDHSNISIDRQVWVTGMLFQLGQVNEADDTLVQLISDHPYDLRTWLLHQSITRKSEPTTDIKGTLAEINKLPPSAQRDFLAAEISLASGQIEQANDLYSVSWKEGTLDEPQWRTLIDFLRWRKDASLEPVVERARARFPAAPWLDEKPRS
jgi:tetratricopeptide (TPR) repeat protein